MDIVGILQQVGLTQYEAEAYFTLLREGPLTGYQLGKRSRVPLPRSYDVLERLVDRGLAMIQPGDPPRYLAEDAARFLDQLRRDTTARLEELAAHLAELASTDGGEEFWVIRGRGRIRERVAAMIRESRTSLALRLPEPLDAGLGELVAEARGRGCKVLSTVRAVPSVDDAVLVLVDDRSVLAGTVAGERCQAVVTRNPTLVRMARACFAVELPPTLALHPAAPAGRPNDWLAWEDDKQRRLRLLVHDGDVA